MSVAALFIGDVTWEVILVVWVAVVSSKKVVPFILGYSDGDLRNHALIPDVGKTVVSDRCCGHRGVVPCRRRCHRCLRFCVSRVVRSLLGAALSRLAAADFRVFVNLGSVAKVCV